MSKEISDKQKIEAMNACARKGDTKGLYLLIKQDPYILQKIDKIPFIHTPLHEAAGQGQTSFAIEIMSLLPSLGKKLDSDGFSPLHIALKEHKKETVLALVKFDKSLVRVKGFEGFTPLHYAAKYYPDLEILSCFLLDCQESINDLNNRFQSAVHLVMESRNIDAIDLVLKWLKRTARAPVLGRKDENSNTALHVAAHEITAVSYDDFPQMEKSEIDKINEARTNAVKIMVKIAKLNKRNSDNKTPLDIALKDKNGLVADILKEANAKTSEELSPKETRPNYLRAETNILERAVRGYCFLLKDLTVGMRSVVLVVAVLIATATYQAVLQPPGGFYPAESSDSGNTTAANTTGITARRALVAPPPPSNAGKMMMGEAEYKHFMPANTAAFTLSMAIIIFVLHGRPYNLILHACLIFLGNSYLVAMKWSSVYNKGVCGSLFVLSWSVISAAFVLKMMYYAVKALFEDVWWLRGGGVTWHNMSYVNDQGATCQKVMRLLRQLRRQNKLIQRLTTTN